MSDWHPVDERPRGVDRPGHVDGTLDVELLLRDGSIRIGFLLGPAHQMIREAPGVKRKASPGEVLGWRYIERVQVPYPVFDRV